jgi:hypothetical protein
MADHVSHELHAAEWEMLAEQRAHIDLIRAIVGTHAREASICQHGHTHAELFEPDMRYVPVSLN